MYCSCSRVRYTVYVVSWSSCVYYGDIRKTNYLIRFGNVVRRITTAEYWDVTPNNEEDQSSLKAGGYEWAGGFIDPSVKLEGYMEHPTLTEEESMSKFDEFRRGFDIWKVRRQLMMSADNL